MGRQHGALAEDDLTNDLIAPATSQQDTDRDFFMSAQEAVEYGLIDAVVQKPQIALAGAH